jgi:signal transduction histidine kinase
MNCISGWLKSGTSGPYGTVNPPHTAVLESAESFLVRPKPSLRIAALLAAVIVVSLLHYQTPTHHVWLHPLLQRAYYIPLLLMALWYGWRGGILAAVVAGLLYIPHIELSWSERPEYNATQWVEVAMFFVLTGLTGLLADHERAQRSKAESAARQLAQANEQLRSSFDQLRRADRLSAMGELSAGLAHEIRNPLGSIEGAAQILRRAHLPESTKQEFGELAQRELDRLKGILNQFLDFARPRESRRSPVDPQLLLDSVAQLSAETAKMNGVRISVAPTSGLSEVLMDAEQIKQVLLNLVINAIQAMPEGGVIVLRALADGGCLCLEIQDQGMGITPQDLERIFDPFFTTKEKGTGLGLSIAARIIAQHGGEIEPRRNPGGGMTFSVKLPLVESRASAGQSVEVGG